MVGKPVSRQQWKKAVRGARAGESVGMDILRVSELWPQFSSKERGKQLVLNQIRKMMKGEKIEDVGDSIKYIREQLAGGRITIKDLIGMKFKFAPVGAMTDWEVHKKRVAIDHVIEMASGKKISTKYRTRPYASQHDFIMATERL